MREIKFRVWDKINKKWIKNFNIDLLNIDVSELPNIEIMQYTGLKDKNRKEIYEGDIIQIPDNYDEYGLNAGEIYQVYFTYGGFRLKPKYQPNARGMWLEDDGEFEVIGNIHENPELLKENR